MESVLGEIRLGRRKDERRGTGTAKCWCVWRVYVAGTRGTLFVKSHVVEAGMKC